MRRLKSLVFYPLFWSGGLLYWAGRILMWFSLVGFVLFWGFKMAGELEVSWWSVGALGVTSVVGYALSELCVDVLFRLRPGER